MARASSRGTPHASRALLLRRVAHGESDLVVTLLTEELGKISALARAAKKSQRRFGGSLEPMHTLHVRFDERAGAELAMLREARIDRARTRLTRELDRLEAAGRALGWVRHAAPPRTPEPQAWSVTEALLDRLDAHEAVAPKLELAAHGLLLLSAFGWGIELGRCVSCGKPCPPAGAAMVDAARGGLVCTRCGGARIKLSGARRERVARAAAGEPSALSSDDVSVTLEIVEAALAAHAGV